MDTPYCAFISLLWVTLGSLLVIDCLVNLFFCLLLFSGWTRSSRFELESLEDTIQTRSGTKSTNVNLCLEGRGLWYKIVSMGSPQEPFTGRAFVRYKLCKPYERTALSGPL